MYNYSINMAYQPAGGPATQGPVSLILTLPQLHGTVGPSHLTFTLTWDLSYFQG